MIHSTAVVHPGASVDPSVEIGPFSVIDEHVVVGAGCRVGPHVHLTGWTTLGTGNRIHSGCVIGDAPQDLKYRDEPTELCIGDDNVFREHVTVHRSAKAGEATRIGSRNFLMVNSHVGHNSELGNHILLANGALIAGHVHIADRVFISGNCLVHQFVRIGTLALMQGGAGIGKDLPPFTIARGINGICGLNVVGLRRAGFSPEQRLELKRLYHALFRGGRKFSDALAAARMEFTGETARTLIDFVSAGKRGICLDTGTQEDGEEDA
jgi:UDP-N-acetylglucosamine acyltransferase